MSEVELSRCPFCGGEAVKRVVTEQGYKYLYVTCTSCGAIGPTYRTIKPRVLDEENPAVKAWNKRN